MIISRITSALREGCGTPLQISFCVIVVETMKINIGSTSMSSRGKFEKGKRAYRLDL